MVGDGDEGWGSGFLIGVEDMGREGGGGSSKFDGGDLSQYMGCQKIPVKEFM